MAEIVMRQAFRPQGPPPDWAASLRSPGLLGTFFASGAIAGILDVLLNGLGLLPFLRNVTGYSAFPLVVLAGAVLGLALAARRLRPGFLLVGFLTGFCGVVFGMYVTFIALSALGLMSM